MSKITALHVTGQASMPDDLLTNDVRAAAQRRIAHEERERAEAARRVLDLERFEATQVIRGLILCYGAARVAAWVLTQAAELREEVGS